MSNDVGNDCVCKLFMQDLSYLTPKDDGWSLKLNESNNEIFMTQLQIQGTICKTTGFNNEIMIIGDKTGKAKATRGPNVPGDFSWLTTGVTCTIIGTLLEGGKLPHVAIVKLAKVENIVLEEMWEYEVLELKQFFMNKIHPYLGLQ